MTAGWVAGSTRGRLLARRRLGRVGSREVASAGGVDAAVRLLARSSYGRDVRPGSSVDVARRAVGDVCVWHLRVLAGWLPPRGGEVVRVFAARFELVNIADHLAALAGEPGRRTYALGGVATAWPRVAAASSPAEVRLALAGTAWGDPGTTGWPEVAVPLEARWADRLAAAVPDRPAWAAGSAALVVSRQVALGQVVDDRAVVVLRRLLGRGWEGASDLHDLAGRLPPTASWVLDGIDRSEGLWRAEGMWWQRVDREADALLRTGRPGPAVAAAAAARLVADAWRVQAALEAASWGRAGVEVFDAVA